MLAAVCYEHPMSHTHAVCWNRPGVGACSSASWQSWGAYVCWRLSNDCSMGEYRVATFWCQVASHST